MSDSQRLYCTLLGAVREANPREDLRRLKVFAWLLTGLLMEKSISLPLLATVMVSAAKAASRVRRLRRFLANERVQVRRYYDGLIRRALVAWSKQTIYVAIDTTSVANRLVICRVALVYRGRAVPLVWQVYQRQSVMLAFEAYKELLEHSCSVLPAQAQIVLLGDRGFRTTDLMDWCRAHGWHFRLRLKADQLVKVPGHPLQSFSQLRLRPGMVRFLHDVRLGVEHYGPLHIAMAWADTPNAERWIIATDEAPGLHTLNDYARRMDIDESFLDDKSGGFHLEDSLLPDAESLSRLLLVMAVAALYLVSLGTFVVEADQRQAVDPHWGRGLSYFQIGWRWLRHRLAQRLPLPACFQLSSNPDPDPVILPRSRRQPISWTEWHPAHAAA
jgi:hypothetical protein